MTANQVAYQQMQEAKRHNLVEESLKGDIQDAQKKRYENQNYVDSMNMQTNIDKVKVSQQMADQDKIKANASASQAETAAKAQKADALYKASKAATDWLDAILPF